jgi:LysR family transcriptional regulator, nitrogen assimilation regulatory protein
MDLRILQAFIRVAELGSIARAANVLNQTQPTISRQIAALETEVGGPLFIRHRRGMSLSPGGERFRDRAMHALRVLIRRRPSSLRMPESRLAPFQSACRRLCFPY